MFNDLLQKIDTEDNKGAQIVLSHVAQSAETLNIRQIYKLSNLFFKKDSLVCQKL